MPVHDRHNEAIPPPCRWRSSDETLDVMEALERIEALLIALDERVRRFESTVDAPPPAFTRSAGRAETETRVSTR